MKQIFYKHAPVILVATGFILWVAGRFLDEYTLIHEWLIWLPYVSFQMLIGLICGILIKKLHQGANKDDLTGLWNRRYFYEKMAEEIERFKRTKAPLSLAMIDIDDFKGINDSYGHVFGDKVLKQLAGIFQQNTRSIDTVARWGGEEFAIILPETSVGGATVFAERLRGVIEGYNFNCRVTISIGVVSVKEDMDIDSLVVLADNALYKAKKRKNWVSVMNL